MTKRFGFTLAEVLITLGIIGVVAAMTIPTLMNQTNQAEFKTGFKKMISTLNQAVTMNVALDNSDFATLTSGTAATSGSVFNMFTTRMNVIKTTDGADADLDKSVSLTMASASNYTLYFNDGMVFSFPQTAAGCTSSKLEAKCTGVVDVNGVKKPNRLTNCDTASTTATADNAATACTSATALVGDRFSVRFGDQQLLPNGNGARYIMYN